MNEQEERLWCVYIHINKINGKVYIGQTKQVPEKRWGFQGSHYVKNFHFYNAIQKYGWDNFEHIILYNSLTVDEANKLEAKLIAKYDATNQDKGYNIRPGGNNSPLAEETKEKIAEGNRGKIVTEETRKKMSLAQMGKPNAKKGTHLTEETKRKISEAQKGEKAYWYGKKMPDEMCQKLSESHKGIHHKTGKDNPLYGIPRSEETRKRISEALTGKKFSPERVAKMGKHIECVETGKVYISAHEVERKLGYSATHIIACCKGKQHTSHGFHWRYADEEPSEDQ